MERKDLEEVGQELRPATGGRIQRVDRIDEGVWVIEIRIPGRTLRLLIATYPECWLGLLPERPQRRVEGGASQGLLRKRLVGRKVAALGVDGSGLMLEAGETRVLFGRERKGAIRTVASAGRLVEFSEPIPDRFEKAEEMGRRYLEWAPDQAGRTQQSGLERAVRAARKRKARLLAKVRADCERMEELAGQGRFGELLKPAFGSIPRGAREAELIDWATGLPIVVVLDPALSARDNMKRFFARARRGARGLPKAMAKQRDVQAEIDQIDELLDRWASGEVLSSLSVSPEMLRGWGLSPEISVNKGPSREVRHPLDRYTRLYRARDGSEIRVGKTAEGNDRLTASARGPDIWLHARGVPGAHVVLKAHPDRAPDSEALVDAAHLAAHFSSAKNDAKVDVLYTEARNVKKTKGAPAGQVGVARSRTIRVTMDPGRLARLFETGKP